MSRPRLMVSCIKSVETAATTPSRGHGWRRPYCTAGQSRKVTLHPGLRNSFVQTTGELFHPAGADAEYAFLLIHLHSDQRCRQAAAVFGPWVVERKDALLVHDAAANVHNFHRIFARPAQQWKNRCPVPCHTLTDRALRHTRSVHPIVPAKARNNFIQSEGALPMTQVTGGLQEILRVAHHRSAASIMMQAIWPGYWANAFQCWPDGGRET